MGNVQTIIQNMPAEEKIVYMQRQGLNEELISLYMQGMITAEEIIRYVEERNHISHRFHK